MIDLAKCFLQPLRTDDNFILYRVQRRDADTLLTLVPREATHRSLTKLENEFFLAADLDPAWAVLPIELVPNRENMMLVLKDPGGDLLTQVIDEGPADLGTRLRFAARLASVVEKLHGHGLVHRDIRPGNILVTDRGDLLLTGFGIAIHHTLRVPTTTTFAGTLPYMAPEQTGRMGRPVGCRSDLYAVGVTLYEMFTGTLPFSAVDSEEWIHCHLVREPASLSERAPWLPRQICAIILKLLLKEPAARYQTAKGLAVDLEQCLAEWSSRRRIHHFALGRSDAAAAFQIASTLHGRSNEIATLRTAFDSVSETGRTAFALICGPSGVGKSSLVAEFHSWLAPESAFIGTGKFDLRVRDVPYSALTQAFRSLLRQILTRDEETVADWRRILTTALGLNGSLLVELMPELELLLDRRPTLPDPMPQDRQNLFRIGFRRLIGALAGHGRPLVLFVDDLQWLDAATLDIASDLVTQRDVSNLMLIGAYRTDEGGPLHPLLARLDTIRAAGTSVKEIALSALQLTHVAEMIAGTLGCRRARSRPLAKLVHAKTGGNPFFVIQFLQALNQEGLLTFDSQARDWRWDMPRIRARKFADGIADMTVAKLSLLPGSARQVLQTLGSLGSTAEVTDLAAASGRSAREIIASLRPAVQAGLIARNGKSYSFEHDRVQEAAYALQPAEDNPALHLRIGMALAECRRGKTESDNLYIVANQLNRGLSAVSNDAERKQIVAINLAAGTRARNAAAYDAAIVYLQVAHDLLAERLFPDQGATRFAIAFQRAECEFLVGHLDVAEAQLLDLSRSCPNVLAGAEVTRLRANLHTIRGQLTRGIEVCLQFLRQIGIDWRLNPADAEVDEELDHLLGVAGGLSVDQLEALPPMSDPAQRAAMAVFADLIPPCSLADHNLHTVLLLAGARLTLQYGICDESSYPLVCAFSALAIRYGNTELGLRLATFGLALADKRPQLRLSGRTLMVFGHLVAPWVRSIREGQVITRRGLDIAQMNGDLAFVAYSHRGLVSARLFCGDPLEQVRRDADDALAFAEAAGFRLPAEALAIQRNLASSLLGHDEESSFDVPSPAGVHPLESERPVIAFFHYAAQVQINVLAGRPDTALALADRAEKLTWVVRSYPELVDFRFYTALAHAAASNRTRPDGRETHIRGFRHQHQELTVRCALFPANFADRLVLLRAESARMKGRELEAEQLYEEAIRLARDSQFVQIEAIAGECAARFYKERGIRTVVLAYLANARLCYLRWGAGAKARQLERNNPHLPPSEPVRTSLVAPDMAVHQLDVNALFKASRALSGEIVLDGVIRTLMRVTLEHAAAERGVLFLIGNDGPKAVAEAHLGPHGIDVAVWEDGGHDLEFSRLALNYVLRTQTSLNSADPENNNLLSADSYLQQQGYGSLHCLPIVAQAKLVGVLHLESHAAVGAFTPAQAAVLDLLAAQAAISLENTSLYSELREREARIRRLVEANIIGLVIWKRDGLLVEANDAFLRIVGYSRDDLLADRVRCTELTPPEWRQADEEAMAKLATTGVCEPFEKEYFHKGGGRVPVLVGFALFDGKQDEGIAFILDLMERKRAEETLRESERRFSEAQLELAHANRVTAMGQLTALIAHEVKHPIAATVMNANAALRWLAIQPPHLAEVQQTLRSIAEDGNRAIEFIGRIHALVNKAPPEREPLDINGSILDIIALTRSELLKNGVFLRIELASGLPLVLGDRIQMQQVVLNLITNAVQAMSDVSEGTRELWIETKAMSSDGVLVVVQDSGPGLPAESFDRLFDTFYTTKPNGLGMGLSICRSIIEAHDGRLWASDRVPRGAIFQFTLPAPPENATLRGQPASDRSPSGGHTQRPGDNPSRRHVRLMRPSDSRR